jgi:hypothetical protein
MLYRVADGLLAYWEPDRRIVSSRVTGLGDVVAALEAVGALPVGSPVARLHTGYGQTLLHVAADGLAANRSARSPASWWLGDEAGQWHVTALLSGDDRHLLMHVVPAINPATAATLQPVTWWSPS